MSMCFVSNTSKPRMLQTTTQPVTQSVTQSAISTITRSRARPNTSRFNMNDTFAARGRPCPRS